MLPKALESSISEEMFQKLFLLSLLLLVEKCLERRLKEGKLGFGKGGVWGENWGWDEIKSEIKRR